jgi:hypothetical protein
VLTQQEVLRVMVVRGLQTQLAELLSLTLAAAAVVAIAEV